ncbi:1551_t:CDS:2, partial [Cetraspora pellucida]
TIVKVRYVRLSAKEDSNLITSWAVGAYPVGHEDNIIEIVLFVPNNPDERDFETQAIFERDGYYSVSGKIIPGIYEGKKRPKMIVSISTHVMILNKDPKLNKCPLRISLIRAAQESPNVLNNDENAIFNVLINDYAGQNCNFTVKVVFPHLNSRFSYLKNAIRSQESLVFIIRQLEVIYNDFYIYAKDINLVDISSFKRRVFDNSSSSSSEVINNFTFNVLNDNVDDDFELASCSKHARIENSENSDEFTNVFNDTDGNDKELGKVNNLSEVVCNDRVENISEGERFKKSKNGKQVIGHRLRSDSRLAKSDADIVNCE